jgi:F-box-like
MDYLCNFFFLVKGPDDVLLEIFSISEAEDVMSCSQVCVSWQRVIESSERIQKKIYEANVL